MKRKELEKFVGNIMSRVEVLEYTEDGEVGNIYMDRFAREFLSDYSKVASTDKMKALYEFFTGLME
jgi:hypothetical protein